MNFSFVTYQVKNRIGYIQLNRPEKRNALNEQMVEDLKIAFSFAEQDDRAKVIIFYAEGAAFSAGADLAYLQSLQTNTFEENLVDSSNLKELFQQIYAFKKIVIAQVEGHAIAGGCGLATVCDFTFAVPEALFGYTEVKIGFIPAIVMVFLIKKIGEAKARTLLLTGKLINAEVAKEFGIVNEIYQADEIKDKVAEFAQKLAATTSGEAIALTKEMIANVQSMDYEAAFNYAAEMNAKARANEDCKKGIAAFLNKEKITW